MTRGNQRMLPQLLSCLGFSLFSLQVAGGHAPRGAGAALRGAQRHDPGTGTGEPVSAASGLGLGLVKADESHTVAAHETVSNVTVIEIVFF